MAAHARAAIVGLSAAIVVIGEAEWDVRRVPQLVASLARNTWYFVPGVLTALALAMHGRASVHTNWSSPAKDGTDIPAWEKIIGFPRFVVGNFYDDSDRLLFILTSMVALGLCLHRFGDPEARPARRLATLWAIAFMLLPRVLFSTWFFSDRLATWW